jgi:hypothetical protein
MSKTPVSVVLSLTGTSGQAALDIDFSSIVSGMVFVATDITGATGTWVIEMSLLPVDPTTGETATGGGLTLQQANGPGNASVDFATSLPSIFASNYVLAWTLLDEGLSTLSDQQVTVTFVPAPGAVTVTITD